MNNHNSSTQPIFELIDILSRKWMLLIIHSLLLSNGRHFNDIKKELGSISSKMLSQRLTELENAGFVSRDVAGAKPVVITYSLTGKGADLIVLYKSLATWSEKWG